MLLYEELTKEVISSAYQVANTLGYGLIEKDYQVALAAEFKYRNIPYKRECPFELKYREQVIRNKRLDFLIDNKVIVELKVSEFIPKAYVSQVVSYLEATGLQVGLVICFSKNRVIVKRVIKEIRASA